MVLSPGDKHIYPAVEMQYYTPNQAWYSSINDKTKRVAERFA